MSADEKERRRAESLRFKSAVLFAFCAVLVVGLLSQAAALGTLSTVIASLVGLVGFGLIAAIVYVRWVHVPLLKARTDHDTAIMREGGPRKLDDGRIIVLIGVAHGRILTQTHDPNYPMIDAPSSQSSAPTDDIRINTGKRNGNGSQAEPDSLKPKFDQARADALWLIEQAEEYVADEARRTRSPRNDRIIPHWRKLRVAPADWVRITDTLANPGYISKPGQGSQNSLIQPWETLTKLYDAIYHRHVIPLPQGVPVETIQKQFKTVTVNNSQNSYEYTGNQGETVDHLTGAVESLPVYKAGG